MVHRGLSEGEQPTTAVSGHSVLYTPSSKARQRKSLIGLNQRRKVKRQAHFITTALVIFPLYGVMRRLDLQVLSTLFIRHERVALRLVIRPACMHVSNSLTFMEFLQLLRTTRMQ